MLTVLVVLAKEIYADFRGTNGKWVQYASIGIAAVLLVAVIVLVVSIHNFFAPSKTEQAIENRTPVIVQTNANTGVQTVEANKAAQVSSQAEKRSQGAATKANEARNANTKNTNYSEANKQRCLAYPNSEECK